MELVTPVTAISTFDNVDCMTSNVYIIGKEKYTCRKTLLFLIFYHLELHTSLCSPWTKREKKCESFVRHFYLFIISLSKKNIVTRLKSKEKM